MAKFKKKEIELLREYITKPETMEKLFRCGYTMNRKDKQFLQLFKIKPEETKEAVKKIFEEARKDLANT